jgi:hypothetical protein
MSPTRSVFLYGALSGIAAIFLAAQSTNAETKTYVVCNRWNECWRIHEHYTNFPADAQIIYRDDAWWEQHEHDPQWRELPDPSDDHGWYDQNGVWHPFPDAPPPP